MCIQITGPRMEIERRAWLVVGEFFEQDCLFIGLAKNAGRCIAWKPRVQPCERLRSPRPYPPGTRGIALVKRKKSIAQSVRILPADRKDADATLRAARPALEPWTAAYGCVSKSRRHDLDEYRITCGELRRHRLLAQDAPKDGIHIRQLPCVLECMRKLLRRESRRDLRYLGDFITENQIVPP